MPETETPVKEGTPASRFSALLSPAAKQDLASQGKPEPTAAAPASATPEPAKAPDKPAEAKPEAKTTVTAADPDEEILSGKRNPKSEDFKRVKGAAKKASEEAESYKGKLDTYEKELTELRKRPKHNADEIEALRKERDEYKSTVDTALVGMDVNFHKNYDEQVNAVVAGLQGAVSPTVHDKIKDLLRYPDGDATRKALDEILSDASPYEAGEVAAARRDIRKIMGDKQAKLNKASETLQQLAAKNAEQQKARAENLGKAFSEKLTAMADNPLFKKREGEGKEVAEWNSEVDEAVEVAKFIYADELEPQDKADAALRSARFPAVAKENARLNKEVTELRAMLAKIGGAGPGVEAGKGSGAAPDAPRQGRLAGMIGRDLSKARGT